MTAPIFRIKPEIKFQPQGAIHDEGPGVADRSRESDGRPIPLRARFCRTAESVTEAWSCATPGSYAYAGKAESPHLPARRPATSVVSQGYRRGRGRTHLRWGHRERPAVFGGIRQDSYLYCWPHPRLGIRSARSATG